MNSELTPNDEPISSLDLLLTYLAALVLLTGTVTNALTLVLFRQLAAPSRRATPPSRHGHSIYTYLTLLAVLDLCVLFFGLLPEWIRQLTLFDLKR